MKAAVGFTALTIVCAPIAGESRSISGIARVDDQGDLVLASTNVALAGIDVPTFDRVCRRAVIPVRCGPPAILVLQDKVSGFVHCDITGERAPGRLEGRCTVASRRLFDERIDLAAELLRNGWAFARDDAPGLYRSLERLAQTRKLGVWADAAIDLR